jgi:limonene 1,2-monooxygenase
MRLLRDDEPVSMETDWFTLKEARLHITSYTKPHLPIAAAHSFSPAGPAAAGKHGIGLLSIAAAQAGGLISLKEAWSWVEDAAAAEGRTASRDRWRMVIPIHLAESREQAIADVRTNYRIDALDYFRDTLGHPRDDSQDIEQAIERGGAIVGTPDDAIEAVENIVELAGGIGGVLGMAHEWADRESTLRSYELWARYVAPHFQGQLEAPADSRNWVASHRSDIFGPRGASIQRAFEDAGQEIPQALADRAASQRPGA